MVIAPVCAEYLSAYLAETGDAAAMIAGLLILGPLYGGAALIIREVALRTGRGWTGVMLLAAGFGVAMPTLVDLSAWAVDFPSVPYWDAMREPTLVQPLGLAVFPMLAWVTGHVLLSVCAPLALVAAIAPRHRGRPLLGAAGGAVVTTAFVVAAAMIRVDSAPLAAPTALQQVCAAAVVLALVAAALSPLGAPLSPGAVLHQAGPRWCATPGRVLLLAVPAALVLDLLPFGWGGTAVYAAVLAVAGAGIARAARHRWWRLSHITALAVAVVLARSLVGFLSPLPPGVSLTEKITQSAVLLALVVLTCRTAWARARSDWMPPAMTAHR